MSFSRGEFRKIIELMDHAVFLQDVAAEKILWANDAACELLSVEPKDVSKVAPTSLDFFDMDTRERIHPFGKQYLGAASGRIGWDRRTPAGRHIMTPGTAKLISIESSEFIMFQFADVEHERNASTSLARAQAELASLTQKISTGLIVFNRSGIITNANSAAINIVGLSRQEVIGMHISLVAEPRLRASFQEDITRRLRQGAGPTFRTKAVHPDGREVWIEGTAEEILIDNDFYGNLLTLMNISQRVKLENELERKEDHLSYLGRYNAMGDMAMTIAHELGQPLAAATNFLAGLSTRMVGKEIPRAQIQFGLENAMAQITRANQIVSSVRGYVTKLEQVAEDVDLNTIFDEALYFIRLRAETQRVRVDVHRTDLPLVVRCEKIMISQVILNLSNNAIDEMARWPEADRAICIRSFAKDGTGFVEIVDKGRGLEHIPEGRVFDGAFTSKADGNGIGLALCHRIVTRHMGVITAEETVPHGSTMRFGLPLVVAN
ncbi:PAS domain S-box protein [Arthrobacter sp. FW306-2-2C-D06B]|uniref:PAS domain S-box protein n=1 Tax=Arthrobacter sp. FW306-2-2C-D06B TaxID=2879618 RepID=UPI001F23A5C7|nr:PAS domain S-box protein [Arthrobacter sp. FW306-2-2C-D06B]UKA60536.1 PAS domain S-box protein [Arthrobacter sp. FW306-2-2C-D06B]